MPASMGPGARGDDFKARLLRPVSWVCFAFVVMVPLINLGWSPEITVTVGVLATALFSVLLALAKLDKLFPLINIGLAIALFYTFPSEISRQPSQPQSYPAAEKNKAAFEGLQKAIDNKEKDCVARTGVHCDF